VTIQQIGYNALADDAALEAYTKTNPPAGQGPHFGRRIHAQGIFERRDDYCATAFVYSRTPQPVARLAVDIALTDIGRLDYEGPMAFEQVRS
jgi:hypothetical protein